MPRYFRTKASPPELALELLSTTWLPAVPRGLTWSSQLRGLTILVLTAALLACSGRDSTAPLPPKTVRVVNYLMVPVTVTVDGTTYGSVSCCSRSADISVPGSALRLSYVVGKSHYSDGTPVSDDISGETVTLPSTSSQLNINNVIGGTPYISPTLANRTGVTVGVAVYRLGVITCLGSQETSEFYSRWGYWQLSSDLEFRIYQNIGCTGSYRYWSSAVLSGYEVNSGNIFLAPTIAP